MKSSENGNNKNENQKIRLILLIGMSVVIFVTAAMIITALLTLSDLRNDVKQMNDQMDVFQQEMVKARDNK
jgi:flagellar basal body-associated protein FliL